MFPEFVSACMLTRSLKYFHKVVIPSEVVHTASGKSKTIFLRYKSSTERCSFVDGDRYGDLIRRVIPSFGLSLSDWVYMHCLGADGKRISPYDHVPNEFDNSVSGFSSLNPIYLKIYTSLYVRFGQRTAPVSIRGCENIGDIAYPVLKKISTNATCAEQLIFKLASDPHTPLDHSTELPDPSLHQEDNPIIVEVMTAEIQLAEQIDNFPSGRFEPHTFYSDAELLEEGVGLVRAGPEGYPIRGPTVTRLHALKPGERYIIKPYQAQHFHIWQKRNSDSVEISAWFGLIGRSRMRRAR